MKKVYCLDCDRAISIQNDAEFGDEIVCHSCEAEFELVSLNPPAIEWLYDDDDWDNDLDEATDEDDND